MSVHLSGERKVSGRKTGNFAGESKGPRAGVDDMKESQIIPLKLSEANALVKQWHRHHKPVIGHKFAIGLVLAIAPTRIIGVAIVGRPVARMLDDGLTLEVNRVAVPDGQKNACSQLYGACRKAAFALGYKRLVTYTLPSESGASLRAAGYRLIGEAGGGTWDRQSRPRVDNAPTQSKLRWEVVA